MNLNLLKLLNCNKSLFEISVKLLSIWYLITFFPLAFNFNELFGPEKLIVQSQLIYRWYNLGNLILMADSIYLNFSLYVLSIIAAIWAFIKPKHILVLILLYFLHLNLGMFIYPAQTSGWNIINNIFLFVICSFFLAKLSDGKFSEDSFLTPLYRWQVVILYSQNGYLKATGSEWFFGNALKHVLFNRDFANFSNLYNWIPFSIFSFFSGCILIFFLSFWISLFFKKMNKIYVFFGMILHFGIFINFGLTTFLFGMEILFLGFFFHREGSLYRFYPIEIKKGA